MKGIRKRLKSFVPVMLSASMVLSMATAGFTVYAKCDDDNGSVYVSDNENFTATKISHSEQGTKVPDGIVDYVGDGVLTDDITGVGDRSQNYSWSAIGYGDYMYVGTCANAMLTTLGFMKSTLGDYYDEEKMTATLNTIFNGHFFIGEEDGGDPKGILVKVNTKTKDVTLLMSKATTNTNCNFRNAVEYNGMLYFCGAVNGLPCLYQVNPETDECTNVYQSISVADYYKAYQMSISVGIRGMCVYKDKLIVSFVGLDGAYICETTNPSDPTSYKVIANMNDMCNYPAYHYADSIYGGSVWDMVEFNGSLYVVLCTGTPDNKPDENTMQSFAMIRGDIDNNGNWAWTSVIGDQKEYGSKYTFGIDPERTRSGAANLAVYGDHLYIGEYNDEEISLEDIMFKKNCDFVNANLEQSVNLYRMDKDENIELVVGDADNMFPDGSLTLFDSGFGRNENQYIWRMQVYNNKLYVGTFDTSSLLEPIGQFTNGDILKMSIKEWKSQINYIKILIDIMTKKPATPENVISNSSIKLNKQQQDEMLNSLKKVDYNEALSTSDTQKILQVMDSLDEIGDMLNDNMSNEFIAKYETLLNKINSLPNLPAIIKEKISSIINEENIHNLKSFVKCGMYLSNATRGFDLYTIDEDMCVETVTDNGFGDPYNHGCRVFAVTNQGLHIGTANPFYGTQLWNLQYKINYTIGDINNDGDVSLADAVIIQKALLGLVELNYTQQLAGDVDTDGEITIKDAVILQKYLLNSENIDYPIGQKVSILL